MHRSFAPTPRRRALARAAGVVLESPAWTAAFAVAAGALALAATAAGAAAHLHGSAQATFAHASDGDVVARATATGAAGPVASVLAAALPLVVACAAGALAAAAALARGLFVPRRQVRGAPAPPSAPITDAALALARAATVAAVATSFVISHLGDLAGLAAAAIHADAPAETARAAGAALALSALAHAAGAAAVLATLDAVVRQRRLAAGLRMTAREARDDAREAGGDPHARRRLRDARAHDPRDHLRDAAVLLVGADAVVALRWTPGMSAPEVVATGRGLAGRQLVAAARHRAVPALADDALATSLAGLRAVPAAHQATVAHALAAVGVTTA